MAKKSNRVGVARPAARRSPPVIIVSAQTTEQIARRRLIRESFHDSKATTVAVASRPHRHR